LISFCCAREIRKLSRDDAFCIPDHRVLKCVIAFPGIRVIMRFHRHPHGLASIVDVVRHVAIGPPRQASEVGSDTLLVPNDGNGSSILSGARSGDVASIVDTKTTTAAPRKSSYGARLGSWGSRSHGRDAQAQRRYSRSHD
jgi:hypothetical protein